MASAYGAPQTWTAQTFAHDRVIIQVESARYIAALARFTQDMTESLKTQVLMSHGLELLKRIIMRTPVRTGRAQNSWHLVGPGEPSVHIYSDRHGHSFDGSLGETAGPMEVIVGSNVPYMIALEAGHSSQAPSGMVAVSVAELRTSLEKKIVTTIDASWRRSGP